MSKTVDTRQTVMVELLGRAMLSTYLLWKDGSAPRSFLAKNTYYRHRREILDKLGLDISVSYSELAANSAPRSVDDTTEEYLKKRIIKDPDPNQKILDLVA